MIRLLDGDTPVVRAIKVVRIGFFTPDIICTIGDERETLRCHGGKLGVEVEIRHGLSLSIISFAPNRDNV